MCHTEHLLKIKTSEGKIQLSQCQETCISKNMPHITTSERAIQEALIERILGYRKRDCIHWASSIYYLWTIEILLHWKITTLISLSYSMKLRLDVSMCIGNEYVRIMSTAQEIAKKLRTYLWEESSMGYNFDITIFIITITRE